MKKIITMTVALVSALVLVALAVANRHSVKLVLDPFRPEAPALSIDLPFYAYLLGALIAGVALGGVATWFNQGRWRRSANIRTREARRWQSEAERLTRERDDMLTSAKAVSGGTDRNRNLTLAAQN